MKCESPQSRVASPPLTARGRRPGFTLVELCVGIAILALLLALLLPVVQSVRAAARLTECQNHLHQLGTALHQYEGIHGMWAPGSSHGHSWHIAILPMIGQRELFDQAMVNWQIGQPGLLIRHVQIDVYLCPADNAPAVTPFDGSQIAATNYQGCSGTGVLHGGFNGVFRNLRPWRPALYDDGPVRSANILDGLSNTAAVSEVLHGINEWPPERLRGNWELPQEYTAADNDEFVAACEGIPDDPPETGWRGIANARGWKWVEGNIGYSMYNHALPPNRPSCQNGQDVMRGIYTAASRHPGIVEVLYADNHSDATSESIDRNVWLASGSSSERESCGPP